MPNIRSETLENLVAGFLEAAGCLNGNRQNEWMDGGDYARNTMREALEELAARFQQNSSIENNPVFRPVLDTLKTFPDLSDLEALAQALKPLPIPAYVENKNPFKNSTRKP